MALVAPRIVNEVSNVRRINHESDFSWQAQYLVKSSRVENSKEAKSRVEIRRVNNSRAEYSRAANNREEQSRVETSREE